MKASNKFLFAAIVLTLLSLVVYDILLKAAYKSGKLCGSRTKIL